MTDVMGSHSWAERLMECYKQGYSDVEVAATMNMTRKEFFQNINDNPTFAKVVEYGRTLSAAFWEGLARQNVKNKTFNTPLYNFYMKNKFGWADKIETNNTSEVTNLSIDQLKSEINKKLNKLKDEHGVEMTDSQHVLKPVVVQEDDEPND